MRLLHIGLYNEKEPQMGLRRALSNHFDYKEITWLVKDIKTLNEGIKGSMPYYDILFCQIQTPGILEATTFMEWYKHGKIVFNFTGDVRQPLPQWYWDLAPYCITLFTNNNDVELLINRGFKSYYFQIGYDELIYHPEKNNEHDLSDKFNIVFMGNNYLNNKFPLSTFRTEMINKLLEEFGNDFQLFGSNWPKAFNAIDLNFNQQKEAEVYRKCKIAINLSHFNLKNYSSDRLFRIGGSGAFCLSHNFQGFIMEYGMPELAWDNINDLKNKIKHYLQSDFEPIRKDLSLKFHNFISANYSWEKRIQQLKEIYDQNK